MTRLHLMPRAVAAVLALSAPAIVESTSRDAQASVSIAVTWDALLRESTAAVVAAPMEAHSVWEGGRIYTYTHVQIVRTIAGDAGGDAWVRTMGGVVGKVGQLVEGEAVFVTARPSLTFLRPGPAGTLEVTARGQGQFDLLADDGPTRTLRVVRNDAVGALVPPRASATGAQVRLAAEMLHGRAVDDAARDVAAAWGVAHAH